MTSQSPNTTAGIVVLFTVITTSLLGLLSLTAAAGKRKKLRDSDRCNYVLGHVLNLNNYYDKHLNPNGYITLSIAENGISGKLVLDRLVRTSKPRSEWLCYGDPRGRESFRKAIISFLERYCITSHCYPTPTTSRVSLNPDALYVVAGCTAALEVVFGAICVPGDAILVPAPCFSGFDRIQENSGIQIVTASIPLREQTFPKLVIKHLQQQVDSYVEENGRVPKCVLLTSPHNPTGLIWSQAWLEEICAWAIDNVRMHVVVDEVYALSIHQTYTETKPDTAVFWSVHNLTRYVKAGKLHIISGMSKDFGVSGLRCGYLYSENKSIECAMHRIHSSEVSGDTQMMLQETLMDSAWLVQFVEQSQSSLYNARTRITASLEQHGIKVFPNSHAGVFILLDLRPYLVEQSFVGERQLWHKLMNEARVNLTPGENMHVKEPGWFRLCFAYHADIDVVLQGVSRIVSCLDHRK